MTTNYLTAFKSVYDFRLRNESSSFERNSKITFALSHVYIKHLGSDRKEVNVNMNIIIFSYKYSL